MFVSEMGSVSGIPQSALVANAAAPRGLDPEGLSRIAASLADQFATLYDASPVDPRASFAGDVVTFAFEGGLSPSDQWLLDAGREEQLQEFREHFLRVIGDQMKEVVEGLSAVEVRHIFPTFEAADRTTSCFFIVVPNARGETEQRQALLNWSEQVRRNARDLRERHRAAREAHERLRELMHAVRVERSGDAGPG
jgi:uncharacterized protein YbcI